MMKLKKCKSCNTYTFKDKCPKCDSKTADAHYKFIKYNLQGGITNNLHTGK